MIRQAYGDESGSGEDFPWMIYAGYVASIDNWLSFTEAWNASLAADPPFIGERFHMSKVWRKPKKHGWPSRTMHERLADLAEVIVEHVDAAAVVVLPREVWNTAARFGTPHVPYTYLINNFITLLLKAPKHIVDKKRDTLNIVLDWQEKQKPMIDRCLPDIRDQLEAEDIAHVDQIHCPRDTSLYVPLQAADMLAWFEMRKRRYPDDDIDNHNAYKTLLKCKKRAWTLQPSHS